MPPMPLVLESQFVDCCTVDCDEAHTKVRQVWGLRRNRYLMFMSLLTGIVVVGGSREARRSVRKPAVHSYACTLNI